MRKVLIHNDFSKHCELFYFKRFVENTMVSLKNPLVLLTTSIILMFTVTIASGDERIGSLPYGSFQKSGYCGISCHGDIHRQWEQAMMSQCYTHHWDEIEYFELAVPHADREEFVSEIKAGCNGCHAPFSYLAGDVPPPRPEENSPANESVSCDLCHSVTGFEGEIPFNFNWIVEPGETKYGPRGTGESPEHKVAKSGFLATAEFCGTCHNEMDGYGIWVKSTHLEWKEGPYSKEGVRCHDCHMTTAEMYTAEMGEKYEDARLHLFHGAHDPTKVKGTVEIRLYPDLKEVEPGEVVVVKAVLFNQKTGHKFPTGSVEDRIVWLHLEAIDVDGNIYHLPVDKKGFEGEEYTIAADEFAYQDMGIALDQPDFPGVQRDGVPVGDRIFRMPYFDPQGRMTIQQWNTKTLGTDYRFGPRETKLETFTFELPPTLPEGPLEITGTLYYSRLVEPVARFLEVPEEEFVPIVVNSKTVTIDIIG